MFNDLLWYLVLLGTDLGYDLVFFGLHSYFWSWCFRTVSLFAFGVSLHLLPIFTGVFLVNSFWWIASGGGSVVDEDTGR
jgi:hypothetical protein